MKLVIFLSLSFLFIGSAHAKLVSKSKDISLVVGGHSHTRLEEVKYQKNPAGKLIPIVQTGA